MEATCIARYLQLMIKRGVRRCGAAVERAWCAHIAALHRAEHRNGGLRECTFHFALSQIRSSNIWSDTNIDAFSRSRQKHRIRLVEHIELGANWRRGPFGIARRN